MVPLRDAKSEHNGQLEELSRLTGELAHEIKNPLSSLKINLRLIREELEDFSDSENGGLADKARGSLARAVRKIAIVQKEADRLEQILDGFLRYVDKTKLQLAGADINELISDMVDFYTPQAQSRRITIRHVLHDVPLVCKVDADMLKQVILNLFINAQRAMSTGGELIIKTSQRNKFAIIEISDTGIGIEPDRLPYIFDAFHSFRPHGSGLGLPIAKKIIDAHNGAISVESELGKGTSFTIKLPVEAG
jgi:two-component system sensor histidine kinase HydH